tara:strand:+ start:2664 stop:3059 length:396 start_codon:yes stop_codon:yes gene_type:complete
LFAKDRIYRELNQAINMSPSELGAWLRTDIAPLAVANYKDSPSLEQSKKLLKLLLKPFAEISAADCQFIQVMLQRLRYLKRCSNRDPQLQLDWENSLRNLGYDIRKENQNTVGASSYFKPATRAGRHQNRH